MFLYVSFGARAGSIAKKEKFTLLNLRIVFASSSTVKVECIMLIYRARADICSHKVRMLYNACF
jgi:hypothetical protein